LSTNSNINTDYSVEKVYFFGREGLVSLGVSARESAKSLLDLDATGEDE
jgi:hypothetical protein